MAKSKMDYGKMEALIKTVESEHKTKIHNALSDNVDGIISQLREVYSGDAADKYQAKFTDTADKVDAAMHSIITQLNTLLDEEQAAYAEQEKKIAESLDGTPTDIQ